MTTIGIDLEQFVRDPYATGIQRVLHQLAMNWPNDMAVAEFVVPVGDRFGLLNSAQATELLAIAFTPREAEVDLSDHVNDYLLNTVTTTVPVGDLLSIYDAWLLPEVSYLPRVFERLDVFHRCMRTTMIGYDTLPQTHPANYRFVPGSAVWVSEYFRWLSTIESVVCISEYAQTSILDRLRRDRTLATTVAHPGGDHLAIRAGNPPADGEPTRFIRVGTMEARKSPQEILAGFRAARAAGANAELVFVGRASSSDDAINDDIRLAIRQGLPVTWIEHAADEQVHDIINGGSAFLSIGIEGYGIPVLEAIRLGTPVLYDGIQPAGDLMAGRGAQRVAAGGVDELAQMFTHYSEPGELAGLRADLTPGAVPTWAEFARGVVAAAQPL
jgi:glycosyltransferase involved in cell wall biosynthesis